MSVTIIPNLVKNKDQNEWLLSRCLESLFSVEPKTQVIIVDDGSPDLGSYYERFSSVRVHVSVLDKNRGFAAAVNRGLWLAKKSAADIVTLLNNDVEIIYPYEKIARRYFDNYPQIGVIGGRLSFPDGAVQAAGVEVTRQGEVQMLDRHALSAVQPGDSFRPKFVPAVTAAFQVLNPKALPDIGPYSEDYYLAYEDVEFCLRSWSVGKWVLFEPAMEGVHYEGATRGVGMPPSEMQSIAQFKRDFARLPYHQIRQEIEAANAILKL